MKQALLYSLKVWLTSVVFGPVLYVFFELIFRSGYFDGIKSSMGFIGYSIPYGLILSIPSWFFFLTLLVIFEYTSVTIKIKKTLLSMAGACLSFAPFFIFFQGDGDPKWFDTFLWGFFYCIVIVTGIWYYKLKPAETTAHSL